MDWQPGRRHGFNLYNLLRTELCRETSLTLRVLRSKPSCAATSVLTLALGLFIFDFGLTQD
jgi:hypothetical protein